MKSIYAITMFVCMLCCASKMNADGTVDLNNYDSQMPIYIYNDHTLASGDDIHVILYYSIEGGPWLPVEVSGTQNSVIQLKEPGYFDAGVGVIPGARSDITTAFYLYAWDGDYNLTGITGHSQPWAQSVGDWDPNSGQPATGPTLEIPNSIVLEGVPEPTTWALGILGAACLYSFRKGTL